MGKILHVNNTSILSISLQNLKCHSMNDIKKMLDEALHEDTLNPDCILLYSALLKLIWKEASSLWMSDKTADLQIRILYM